MAAVTAALSGAVLLSSLNAQLGAIGYTMAAEYVFYLYFALCLFSILSVLAGERLRVAGHTALAISSDFVSRALLLLSVIVVPFVAARLWER